VFGKWHNGSLWPYHPNARGFDEFVGFTSGHWAEYFDPLLERNGEPMRGKGYIADVFTDHALEFIDRNQARPFFCYVPYNTPHSPFAVPPEDWARSRDRPVAMRGLDGDEEDLTVTRCVLEMCENIDRNVGRVLRRLDELALADKTIVIYFNDNGPNSSRWNGGMKGRKGSVDEGGVRTPFFMRWPGKIKPGTTLPQIAGVIDLLPTLTRMAGISVVGRKPLDGRDLSPLLRGEAPNWTDRKIFSHNSNRRGGSVSVRTQQYRLGPTGALFDMLSDPNQTKDISSERPQGAAELRSAVTLWRAEVLGATGEESPRGAGATGDQRPFTVGYREFPRTPLPARDGVPHGGIQRSSNSPNSSYFTSWKSKDGAITWDIEVATTGDYDVEVLYTCPASDVGSTIELGFKGARVAGKVMPAWDPPFYPPYTIPRPAPELLPKEFRSLQLGTVRLEKGRGPLTLRALEIPGASVMEVRQVVLTLRR
jgi:arylsulfatase A-like enzyme